VQTRLGTASERPREPALAAPLPADRLRTCAAPERAGTFAAVYDEVLTGILRDHREGKRSLLLGANDKIARFVRGTIGRGRRVLEIGCGFGRTALEVGRGQSEMFGVDASQVGIDAARQAAAGRPECGFAVMDAGDLRFPDGRFDAAYSIDVVEHLHPDDVGRHLAEVHRVLRSGGIYIVKTPSDLTGPHEGSDPGTQGFLHFQEYRYGTFMPLLRAAGFSRLRSPAFSMRITCRLPGPPRLPSAANLLPESLALMVPYRSRACRRIARVLGVKQVVIAATKS